jgi:hypothetical protein
MRGGTVKEISARKRKRKMGQEGRNLNIGN